MAKRQYVLQLRKRAEAKGFKNPEDFARASGLRYGTVTKVWYGNTKKPGPDVLFESARTLGITIEELYDIVEADVAEEEEDDGNQQPLERAPVQRILIQGVVA